MLWLGSVFWPQKLVPLLRQEFLCSSFFFLNYTDDARPLLVLQ